MKQTFSLALLVFMLSSYARAYDVCTVQSGPLYFTASCEANWDQTEVDLFGSHVNQPGFPYSNTRDQAGRYSCSNSCRDSFEMCVRQAEANCSAARH